MFKASKKYFFLLVFGVKLFFIQYSGFKVTVHTCYIAIKGIRLLPRKVYILLKWCPGTSK